MDLFVAVAGTLAVLVGVVVLTGWALDIVALKSVLPGWVSMKPNTAVAFILTGLALVLTRLPFAPTLQRSAAFSVGGRLCASLAGLIGLATLCELVFSWNPGFDQWLFAEPAGTAGTSVPGRMAPEAALCFVLLAGAVWLTSGRRPTRGVLFASAIAGLVVTALAFSALLTYFTPALGAFGWWGLTIMAVPTAVAFAGLGLAVVSIAWPQTALSWALEKKTTVAFACGLALLVIIGLNTSRSQAQLRETGQRLAHSEQVLGGITTILAEASHIQNHARGFVITGDERFLQSYRTAVAACNAAIEAQRRLVADDPVQQHQLTRFEPQIREMLQWFRQVIDASRTGMTDASRHAMVNHGEDLMEKLRATFQQAESEDRQFIEQSKLKAEAVARLTHSVISAGTLTSLVIFLTVLVGLNRAEAGRNRAEGVLRETNEYLDNLFNYANAPIIVWDPQFRITRFNHAFESLTGRRAEEVNGKSLELLFPPALVESSMTLIKKTTGGERWDTVEIPILNLDGSIRTVLWNSATVFSADGKIPVATIAQGHDITDRKRAEQELHASEEQFRTLANAMPQLAWIAKADGFIFWYNQRWYDYTGTTPEQMEGWGWQSVHDPVALPQVMQNWTGSIASGQPFEMEFPLRGADGQFRTFLTRGHPLTDASGRVVQWFGTNTNVEPLKQAAAKLRETNEYLDNLFNYANAPIIVWDLQFRITRFNHAFESLTRRDAAEVIGKPLEVLFPPALVENSMSLIKKTTGGERWEAVEIPILQLDGSIRTVLWNSATVFDADGKAPVATIAQGHDITDRKQAETALRENEQMLQNILENFPGVVFWKDAQSNYLGCNQAFAVGAGLQNPADLVGKTDFDLAWAATEAEHYRADDAAVMASGQARLHIIETQHQSDGRVIWLDTSKTPLRDLAGKVVGVLGVSADITERKQAEEIIRQERDFSQSALDSLPGLFYLFDDQSRFLRVNQNFEKVSGYSAAELSRMTPLELFEGTNKRRIAEAIQHARQTGEVKAEADFRSKDGTRTPYYFTGKLFQFDGKSCVMGMGMDISERILAEEKIKRTMADLERSNKELEHFAYVASHDLQEPLRMVASYTQLLAQRYENQLDDKARKYIHYAVDGAVRMQTLINDLLAYSRVGRRGKPLAPTDTHVVLGEAIRNLAATIAETHAIITNDDLPVVTADASQLVLVFQNLLGNAIKFRREELPRIHVSARQEGEAWLFAVKDNGIGIEAKYAERVFIIFQRLHTREEYSGTGIGLAVCQRIVDRHGGKIWLESQPGSGTTFFFTIPINPPTQTTDIPKGHEYH